MEQPSSQALATDSFSYSWLTNRRSSFDGVIESLRTSFDICDETIIKEFNKSLQNHHHDNMIYDQDFVFNVLTESKASDSVIHTDEIFADGCIIPAYPNNNQAAISVSAPPISSLESIMECSERNLSPCFLTKIKRSSSRILRKSLSFFAKLGCSRDGVRVDDLDRKVKENKSGCNSYNPSPVRSGDANEKKEERNSDAYWGEIKRKSKKSDAYNKLRNVRSCNNSPWASPPSSPTRLIDTWLHVDCSMDEAILYCKRSFGV